MSTLNGPRIELSCEDVEELLPLHALGVLDADEAAAVQAHLPLCPACSAIAVQFDAVAGAMPLALEPVAPDPAARALLLDRLDERATAPNVTPIGGKRQSARGGWRTLAAAAAFLLMLGGAGYVINDLVSERDDARNQAAMLQEFMRPDGQSMTLEAMPASEYDWGWGSSRLLKNGAGEMMLVVEGCPPTTDDRTYPVWVAVGEERMVVGEIVIDQAGTGWITVSFPEEMPEPEILGVSVVDGDQPLVDLFLGAMTG